VYYPYTIITNVELKRLKSFFYCKIVVIESLFNISKPSHLDTLCLQKTIDNIFSIDIYMYVCIYVCMYSCLHVCYVCYRQCR